MREVLIKAVQRMHLGQSSATPGSRRSLPVVRVSNGEIRTLTDAHLSGFGLRARIGGSWGYSAVVTDGENHNHGAARVLYHGTWLPSRGSDLTRLA